MDLGVSENPKMYKIHLNPYVFKGSKALFFHIPLLQT